MVQLLFGFHLPNCIATLVSYFRTVISLYLHSSLSDQETQHIFYVIFSYQRMLLYSLCVFCVSVDSENFCPS